MLRGVRAAAARGREWGATPWTHRRAPVTLARYRAINLQAKHAPLHELLVRDLHFVGVGWGRGLACRQDHDDGDSDEEESENRTHGGSGHGDGVWPLGLRLAWDRAETHF